MAKKKTKFQAKVKTVMHEFGQGELNTGKSKKKVTNPKQAIAIALSVATKKTKAEKPKQVKKTKPGKVIVDEGVKVIRDKEPRIRAKLRLGLKKRIVKKKK